VYQEKQMFHLSTRSLEACHVYAAVMFNVLIGLDRHLDPDHQMTLNTAEFSHRLAFENVILFYHQVH
jgi:hypothetical protein